MSLAEQNQLGQEHKPIVHDFNKEEYGSYLSSHKRNSYFTQNRFQIRGVKHKDLTLAHLDQGGFKNVTKTLRNAGDP
jgi:hypothetical protein